MHYQPQPSRTVGSSLRTAGRVLIALAAVSVLGASGVGWFTTHNVRQGLTTSRVLASQPHHSLGSDQNILVMGLDSRLDEQGKPLPEALYKALHAGSPDDGGNNANVLMVIHIPGNGSKATAISIPRDDYTELSGCPDSQCQGKIKQAYGLAFDEKAKNMPSGIEPGTRAFEQAARDAGRKAEIDTVSAFLGGVSIDHFVEVTLAAFYEVAQVVAPVTVCVNENTADAFSGAHFHQGSQELDAASAVAFVRQRRDTETGIDFSDLDRERRQQAFIVSLSHKLSQTGTLTDPAKLAQIYDVAKANTAIDSGFDPIGFATNSSAVTSGNASFLTLPIDHFGQTDDGESINVVDPDTIHTIVSSALNGGSSAPTTTSPPGPDMRLDGLTADIVNASGTAGLGGSVQKLLTARGMRPGQLETSRKHQSSSHVGYGSNQVEAAQRIAGLLGIPAQYQTSLDDSSITVVLGTDFTLPPSHEPTSANPPQPVPATGTGANTPQATDLTLMSSGSVPCVK